MIRPAETIPFPEDDETTCFPSGQIFTDLESGRDQMAERNAACENEKQDYRLAVSHSSKKGYAYDYIFRVVPVRILIVSIITLCVTIMRRKWNDSLI